MIFLASTSRYRKELLERLQLEFEVHSPDVDETPYPQEAPYDLVSRLAVEKARAISHQYRQAIVIGSDQMAVFDGQVIGKPGTTERAIAQLQQFSGQSVVFLTAVCVRSEETGYSKHTVIETEVGFRDLSTDEITRYIELDQPLDCAGAFKSELGGSSLLRYLRSDDPTAIIGLPLITVAAMLRENGVLIP